jgi:tetratricopeptide (TPR) repeat protein
LNDLANALDKNGRAYEAIEKYREALGWQPADKTIRANLALTEAEVARNAGEFVSALRKGRDALSLQDRRGTRAFLQATLDEVKRRHARRLVPPLPEPDALQETTFYGEPTLVVTPSDYDRLRARVNEKASKWLRDLIKEKVSEKMVDLTIQVLPFSQIIRALKENVELVQRYKQISIDRVKRTGEYVEVLLSLSTEGAECLADPLGNCEPILEKVEKTAKRYGSEEAEPGRQEAKRISSGLFSHLP